MLNLIQNEQMKIYRRLRTWILGLLLIVIVVSAALISHPGADVGNDQWKVRATENIEHNKKELEQNDLPEKYKNRCKKKSRFSNTCWTITFL